MIELAASPTAWKHEHEINQLDDIVRRIYVLHTPEEI